MLTLDHIVIVAESLEDGRAFVEQRLGVSLEQGGHHALMGTHNLLLGLEGGLYLEVISVDPEVPNPGRLRWFGMDGFGGAPRLTNWVGRSDAIDADIERLFGKGVVPTALSRGDLNWRMSVIDDGQTPFDGLVPMMLDWGDGPKAADRLQPSGCRLKQLVLGHPDHEALRQVLGDMLRDERVRIEFSERPSIKAMMETLLGEVELQ